MADKLPPIKRVRMPDLGSGRPLPNPFRYACGLGHVHPSHRHAAKCRAKWRAEEAAR